MNDSEHLERRYRRLLSFYSKAFRRDNEEEMLTVLMDGAGKDQQHPRPKEAVDLLRSAADTRVFPTKPGSWGYKHPDLVIRIRVAVAIWLSLLAVFFCAHEHRWWGLLFLVPIALHLYLANRVRRTATHR